MMDFIILGLLAVLLVIVLIYLYLDRKYSYWSRRNVPYEPPKSLIFGHAKEIFFEKENIAPIYDEIYRKFEDQPYCGFYEFQNPILMIRDPQLIQTVLVEKFNCFSCNKFSIGVNPSSNELFAYNPFVLTGNRWKETRSMLVPGITANKLRVLDDIVKPIFKNVANYLDKNSSDDIEAFELSKLYTGQVVANFGWGVSGFFEDSSIKKLMDMNQFTENKAVLLQYLHPFWAHLFKLRAFTKEYNEFIQNVTSQAISALETSKTTQHTFLQNLLNAREKLRQNGKDLSLIEISSHMNTFYSDAYDTTARILSFYIQYLMMYPHVQQRLREEIIDFNEEITADSVNKLQYLDMVFYEVVRIFPIAPFLTRTCTEKCKLGSLDVEVGTTILVSTYSMHFDPKYYPDPEKFNPENFSEENKNKRPKFTHFIFGHGPRICVGMKYAMATMKLFICYLLKNYDVLPPSNHPANPMHYNPQSALFYLPKGLLYVKIKKLT